MSKDILDNLELLCDRSDEQEPTTAEWDKLLKNNGFSQSQIDNILN